MNPRRQLPLWALLVVFSLTVVGCTSTAETARIAELEAELQRNNDRVVSLQQDLTEAEQERAQLASAVTDKEQELMQARQQAEEAEAQARAAMENPTPATPMNNTGIDLLPPDARPGECYARLMIPAELDTVTEQVLIREEGTRIETVPAVYETVTERVLVQEESEEVVEVKPAVYEWREERLMTKPASFRLEEVPAVYETVTERVLIRPARQVWKPSQGRIYGAALTDSQGNRITRLDSNTGELMCLVEEPAEYRDVTKRVVKSPATTRRVEIPAEYETVRKRVMVRAPEVVTRTVPARYETRTVRKLVRDAEQRVITIPAEYGSVTKTVVKSEAELAWLPVLCEVNVTQSTIRDLQVALKSAGHYAGPIDGIFGSMTMNGISTYQKANNLPSGGLTFETLERLGVAY